MEQAVLTKMPVNLDFHSLGKLQFYKLENVDICPTTIFQDSHLNSVESLSLTKPTYQENRSN